MKGGIEIRSNNIRISFTTNRQRHRELLNIPPTPDNIDYAEKLVSLINSEIKGGTFNYQKHFPNSPKVQRNQISHFIDLWLDEKRTLVTPETFRCYESRIKKHIRPKWGSVHPQDIAYDDLLAWKNSDLGTYSTKFIKEVINIFKGIIRLCKRQKLITDSPLDFLTVQKADSKEPDPFTLGEIVSLQNAYTSYDSDKRLAIFNLFAGCRPSEVLAMDWGSINLDTGHATIKRACVRGDYKATKNRRSNRYIELLPPALNALREQFESTGKLKPVTVSVRGHDNRTIKQERCRFVWHNPRTDKPYTLIARYGTGFWKKFLDDAGVRYRPFHQTRHTFASQMLSLADIPDSWIVNQMGHSDTTMLYKNYGMLMQQRNRLALGDKAFSLLQEIEPKLSR